MNLTARMKPHGIATVVDAVGPMLCDLGHFMYCDLFDQTPYNAGKVFKMIRVHVLLKTGRALPRFVESEYRGPWALARA